MKPHGRECVEPAWDDRSVLRDELPSHVTAAGRQGATGGSMAAYGWVALLIVASGFLNVLSATKDIAHSGIASLTMPALYETTSAIAWIVFLPLLRTGIAGLFRNRNRPVAYAVALATAVTFASLHLVTMVSLRKLVLGMVAKGYPFHWAADFPYEIRKDIVSALMIGAVFWLIERRASASAGLALAAKPAQESTAETLKQGLWLRDGSTSFHIDPRDIIAVISAGNYVEFKLAAGRRLIRGTLAAEEVRLKPFGLVRVHRTRLANLNRLVAVELRPAGDFLLRMDNGETIAGSRRYRGAAISIRDAANKNRSIAPP